VVTTAVPDHVLRGHRRAKQQHLPMPTRQGPILVGLFLFAAWVAPCIRLTAQPATITLEAARTSVIVETTTPIEVLARYSATVTGVRLVAGDFDSPASAATPLALNETATQLAATFTYTPTQSQPAPSLALDAAWPAGSYAFHLDWKTFSGAAVHGDFAVSSTGDWPQTPVLQTPQPLLPIPSASADFTWQAWDDAPDSGGSISFTLYEGLLTAEMIEQLAAGDYSSLSSFTVVDNAPALAATTASREVSGIDPEMDHILVLEFTTRITGSTAPVPTETRSSRMLTYFYRRELRTYAEWRAENFSEADAANDAVSGPTADPDLDGVANLLEYTLAMSPLASDTTGLPVARVVDGLFAFDHALVVGATDLGLGYEALGEDLVWTTMEPESYSVAMIAASPGRQILRVTPSSTATRKIVRIRATLTSP
jgi:hypothetical protein